MYVPARTWEFCDMRAAQEASWAAGCPKTRSDVMEYESPLTSAVGCVRRGTQYTRVEVL